MPPATIVSMDVHRIGDNSIVQDEVPQYTDIAITISEAPLRDDSTPPPLLLESSRTTVDFVVDNNVDESNVQYGVGCYFSKKKFSLFFRNFENFEFFEILLFFEFLKFFKNHVE